MFKHLSQEIKNENKKKIKSLAKRFNVLINSVNSSTPVLDFGVRFPNMQIGMRDLLKTLRLSDMLLEQKRSHHTIIER